MFYIALVSPPPFPKVNHQRDGQARGSFSPGGVRFFLGGPLPLDRALRMTCSSAGSTINTRDGDHGDNDNGHLQALQSILFFLIPRVQIRKQLPQVLDRRQSGRIVRRHRWALQSLAEDLVARSCTIRVERGREDATLGLVHHRE